jgi:hypothetical protein
MRRSAFEERTCSYGRWKMDKRKLDPRMFLPLLLIPLLVAVRAAKKRKAKKERAAVKALARQLVEERGSGKKHQEKVGKIGIRGRLSEIKGLFGNRVFRFVVMLGLRKLISRKLAEAQESLPPNRLVRRLSKATDI